MSIDFQKCEAKTAVILSRISDEKQEDGISKEAQTERLLRYCQQHNLKVLKIFEFTESSTRGDRKYFLEMIKFCKAQKQIVTVVADKIDRIQRNFREQPLLDGLINEGKIELHFRTEGYSLTEIAPVTVRFT